MRARLVFFALLSSFGGMASGCFGSHADGDSPDAGPAPVDGGVWTECFDALVRGSEGEPCNFATSCSEPSCDESYPGREVLCLDGWLRFVERICTIAPWTSCEEYLPYGHPGDYCDASRFEACAVPSDDPCCTRNVRCGGSFVIDEVVCLEGCVMQPACEDYASPPPELPACRSASQCAEGEACVPPGASRGCGGACRTPMRECATDAECEAGSVCVEELIACSCDGGPDTVCRPPCTAGSCLEGETCGPDGVCAPTSCEDGYACPPNTACAAPGDAGPEDAHGCVRRACDGDADCECGVCLDGQCFSGPGVCRLPAP